MADERDHEKMYFEVGKYLTTLASGSVFRFLAVIGLMPLLCGCFKTDDVNKAIIEQQRINLDTLKQNQETLDKIRQKEKELMQLEKQQADTLRSIEEDKKKLAEYEKRLNSQARDIERRIADNEKLLSEQKATYQKLKEENEYVRGMAVLAQKRLPFVEQLALTTVKILGQYAGYNIWPPNMNPPVLKYDSSGRANDVEWAKAKNIANEYHYNQCLNLINNSGVMAIESDAVFETKAKEVMIRYIERIVPPRKPSGEVTRETIEMTKPIEQIHMRGTE